MNVITHIRYKSLALETCLDQARSGFLAPYLRYYPFIMLKLVSKENTLEI